MEEKYIKNKKDYAKNKKKKTKNCRKEQFKDRLTDGNNCSYNHDNNNNDINGSNYL